jgi:hypothetical protein
VCSFWKWEGERTRGKQEGDGETEMGLVWGVNWRENGKAGLLLLSRSLSVIIDIDIVIER